MGSKRDFIVGTLRDKELLQKLWQSFRIGQTTYIAYGIGLINFTLILYRLAGIDQYIEPIPFAVLLVIIMIPAGVLVGYFHIKKQMPTETKIMAHNNPYIYRAVPFSKETMNLKTMLWQFDFNKINNDFMKLQVEMNKKLWNGMNELSGKQLFTNEDMLRVDKLKKDFDTIGKGIVDWKQKYQQLYDGKHVKDISGAEESYELEQDNTKKD